MTLHDQIVFCEGTGQRKIGSPDRADAKEIEEKANNTRQFNLLVREFEQTQIHRRLNLISPL